MKAKLFLKYWLPVVIWLSVIFIGSTDVMSAEQTSRFIAPFLRWLKPDIAPETIAQIHLAIRKLGHLTEYAILAMLFLRALRRGARNLGEVAHRNFVDPVVVLRGHGRISPVVTLRRAQRRRPMSSSI